MALVDLIEANPWPPERPDVPPVQWGWGIEGAGLLRDLVDPDIRVVLEIGSLLGGSARFWADTYGAAHVLCVDPWVDAETKADRPFLNHVPELVDVIVGRPDGVFDAFLSANWDWKDRITPLRGFSPDRLASVHAAGVQPDVVYIDGSHVYEDVLADLFTARALFPKALLCGDDYNWPAVAAAVNYAVTSRGDVLRTQGNTFAITQDPGVARRAAPSALPVGPARRRWPASVLSRNR